MAETKLDIVLPGHQLVTDSVPVVVSGHGTFQHTSNIYASLAGIPRKTGPRSSKPNSSSTISVPTTPKTLLPNVGALVLARVIRTTHRQAVVNILAVSDPATLAASSSGPATGAADTIRAHYTPAASPSSEFQGLIRQQDIRATEKDKVKVSESFRPGDIVRAVVISLGDQRDYYLSTAGYMPDEGGGAGQKVDGNELGVVVATSERGNAMVPVSWKECRDPVTGVAELRKVARPG